MVLLTRDASFLIGRDSELADESDLLLGQRLNNLLVRLLHV